MRINCCGVALRRNFCCFRHVEDCWKNRMFRRAFLAFCDFIVRPARTWATCTLLLHRRPHRWLQGFHQARKSNLIPTEIVYKPWEIRKELVLETKKGYRPTFHKIPEMDFHMLKASIQSPVDNIFSIGLREIFFCLLYAEIPISWVGMRQKNELTWTVTKRRRFMFRSNAASPMSENLELIFGTFSSKDK